MPCKDPVQLRRASGFPDRSPAIQPPGTTRAEFYAVDSQDAVALLYSSRPVDPSIPRIPRFIPDLTMGPENLNVRLPMGLDRLNSVSLLFSGSGSQDPKLAAISSKRSVKRTCRQRRGAHISSKPAKNNHYVSILFLTTIIGIGTAAVQLTDETCWPHAPNTTGGPLIVPQTSKFPNGFLRPARGWNSWGIQATPNTTPSYPREELGRVTNQEFTVLQCTVLTDPPIRGAGQPGTPRDTRDKSMHGTNVSVWSTFIDHVDKNNNCYFDYENLDTQLYHDALIALWASWGVDMIKLGYVTPGSNVQDTRMPGILNRYCVPPRD
ncbi:hypothetical protein BDW60DRAFT_210802 [Aspergillus nidulans var. acristatus]